jgi:hypothetical protein
MKNFNFDETNYLNLNELWQENRNKLRVEEKRQSASQEILMRVKQNLPVAQGITSRKQFSQDHCWTISRLFQACRIHVECSRQTNITYAFINFVDIHVYAHASDHEPPLLTVKSTCFSRKSRIWRKSKSRIALTIGGGPVVCRRIGVNAFFI